MRKKGENSVKRAGKSAIPPDEMMISPLVSKVNPSTSRWWATWSRRLSARHPSRGLGYCMNEIRTSSQVCRNAHQREIQGSDGILGTPENGLRQPLG